MNELRSLKFLKGVRVLVLDRIVSSQTAKSGYPVGVWYNNDKKVADFKEQKFNGRTATPVDDVGGAHLKVCFLLVNVLLRSSLFTMLSRGEQPFELFAVCFAKFQWQRGTKALKVTSEKFKDGFFGMFLEVQYSVVHFHKWIGVQIFVKRKGLIESLEEKNKETLRLKNFCNLVRYLEKINEALKYCSTGQKGGSRLRKTAVLDLEAIVERHGSKKLSVGDKTKP